jgi:hypothetical protein
MQFTLLAASTVLYENQVRQVQLSEYQKANPGKGGSLKGPVQYMAGVS